MDSMHKGNAVKLHHIQLPEKAEAYAIMIPTPRYNVIHIIVRKRNCLALLSREFTLLFPDLIKAHFILLSSVITMLSKIVLHLFLRLHTVRFPHKRITSRGIVYIFVSLQDVIDQPLDS